MRKLKKILLILFLVFLSTNKLVLAKDYILNKEEIASLNAIEAFIKKSSELESVIWPGYFFHKIPLIMQSYNNDILINFEENGFKDIIVDFKKEKFNSLNIAVKKDKYLNIPVGMIFPIFINKKPIFFPYIPVKEIANESYKQFKIDLELDYDLYMITWYHEAFHAFQIKNWQPFISLALDQKKYIEGIKDKAVYPLMKEEGEHLYKAVTSKNNTEIIDNLKLFFQVRKKRRNLLSEETINMEKIFELMEGTAQYVERKTALILIKSPPKLNNEYYHNFINGNNIFEEKLKLIKSLDYENTIMKGNWAYNWGMAQALILDELYPKWKLEMNNKIFFLEDKIEEIIKNKNLDSNF